MSTRHEVMRCVVERNLPALRAAVAAGHSVNERALFGVTPLMRAAERNLVDFVRVLLESGAELEAQASYGSTALFDACDNSASDAALLLIYRGARGDAQGSGGRTSLQIAVKRGLVSVVRAMLESGQADPDAKGLSGKTAIAYVPSRGACADELRRLILDYTSIENAIASKNIKAMELVLNRTLTNDDLQASVDAFLAATSAAPLESFRRQLLLGAIASNSTDQFERVLLAGSGAGKERLAALNELRFQSHSGRSALHIAAFYGHAHFVKYLLLECDMDPCVEDSLRRRPVQLVEDRKDPHGEVRALLVQVTHQRHFQEFTDRLLRCSGGLSQLEDLAQSLASVHDIRAVLSLGVSTLVARPEDMKRVLTRAFSRLIDEKLVYNDDEALFCKMVLRECLRRGFITEVEYEYWNMQVVKVNMESAPRVAALKQSVLRVDLRAQRLERRVNALHTEYNNLREAVRGEAGADESSLVTHSRSSPPFSVMLLEKARVVVSSTAFLT